MQCALLCRISLPCDAQIETLVTERLPARLPSVRALGCRRPPIVGFFGERPSFERCGSCDNCQRLTEHGADVTRDYTAEALILLQCLEASPSTALGQLVSLVRGKKLKYEPFGRKKQVHGCISQLSDSAKLFPRQLPQPHRPPPLPSACGYILPGSTL